MDKIRTNLILCIVLVIEIILAIFLLDVINEVKNIKNVTILGTAEAATIKNVVEEPEPEPEETLLMSNEDIDLIALVTMAEAEGEPIDGQRLVIDVILNRLDWGYYGSTVKDVIYSPNQFTSMWNGRSDRCYVREDIRNLVIEELKSRTNYDVLFFRTDFYHNFGTPVTQIGNHYFSTK